MEFALKNLFVAAPLLFFWGLGITPLAINLANRYKIIDHPGERKIHSTPTPRGAGIVLWLGFLLWCLFSAGPHPIVRYIGAGGTIVFLGGYRDDMKSLEPLIRLGTHVLAALFFLIPAKLSPGHSAISLLWITGMTNAYNLIDGANGLCLLMFITACLFASPLGNSTIFISLASLAGGLLYWNFPKARTFLGDGGTTLLGYLFACFFIYTMSLGLNMVGTIELPFLLLLAGGVPVVDTLFAILRRIWGARSPFSPDRGHIHHRLIDMGLSPLWTVAFLVIVQCLIVGTGTFLFNERLN